MKTLNKAIYQSPVVTILEMNVHKIICTSGQTENTYEEDLFS